MKKIINFTAALLLLLLAACTSTPAKAPAERSRAIALGQTLLESIDRNDYAQFSKIAPAELLKAMDEAKFSNARENIIAQFGKITDFHFLTALKTPSVENLIWIVTFERKSVDGKKTIQQQVLFRTVCGELDGQTVLLSFGFF
ncbi:MAG: hypothetical protein AB7F32_13100 [Victivallaceae bacterium]